MFSLASLIVDGSQELSVPSKAAAVLLTSNVMFSASCSPPCAVLAEICVCALMARCVMPKMEKGRRSGTNKGGSGSKIPKI